MKLGNSIKIKSERGFSLIEVLVALALLGIIAVAFLGGLATASKALIIADERATTESLARSQMEYVKNQDYEPADPGSEATYVKIGDIPDGYSICSLNRNNAIVQDIIGVPWDLAPPAGPVDTDVGLQFIRLVIKHGDKEVITLDGAKVDR